MLIELDKSPQVGNVPPYLPQAMTNVDSDNSDSKANVKFSNSENFSNSAYQNKILNTDSSNHHNGGSNSSSTTPSRTHVHRKGSRKLLHRCPFDHCCKNRSSGQYNRGASRNTGCNASMTFSNIPVENQEETTKSPSNVIPDPSRVSSNDHHNYYYYYIHNNHYYHNNGTERLQVNFPYNHNTNSTTTTTTALPEVNSKRVVLTRGIQNTPSPTAPQEQTNQQQQDLRVQPNYRKKAINYMMTHLHLRGSENDEALEDVRKRIERLEDQVYNSVNSKDQYVNLLATKLGAIMETLERLYTCHTTTRLSHAQTHPPTPPQPACV